MVKALFLKNIKSIVYTFKQAYSCDKVLLPLMIANMAVDSIIPFISIVFSKYIIDELTIGKNVEKSLLLVLAFSISWFVLNSINALIDAVVSCKKEKLIQQHYRVFSNKTMSMDLQDIEDPDISDHKTRAQKVITWNSRNIDGVKNAIGGIISYLIQIVGYIYILSKLNVFVVLIIIAVVCVNAVMNNLSNKVHRKNDVEVTPITRKWNYLSSIADDYTYGKLIRIYDFKDFIVKKCKENRDCYKQKQKKIYKFDFYAGVLLSLVALLQEGAVYMFLATAAISGDITLGEFSMYLAATIGMTGAINNFVGFSVGLNYTSDYIKDFIDFVTLPDSMTKQGQKRVDKDVGVFEFKNVSFRYPHTEKYVLKRINVKFNSNEQISLVGENGAGKSTFIKLLMRFYDPTEGDIFLNGINIKEYNYSEYLKIFSSVFQDYQLFCFTISENIAFGESQYKENELKIREALNEVGMLKKINLLPQGIYTYLGKGFEEDGIELSGGEMQKLAIARAIYKDSEVFIMDEPAANLSPVAEYDIIRRFNYSVRKKFVVYISHRLTSSTFSNRILVFKNSQIIEDGSHKKLMENDGFYKKMFSLQSAYYLNNNEDENKHD